MATEGRVSVDPTFTPWQLGVGKKMALLGLMIMMVAVVVGIVVATIVSGYYEYPKSVRDAALAGDDILSDFGTIGAVMAWLAPLKFVGLGTILTGIGVLLWGIINTLRVRATVLAEVVPQLVKKN